MSILTHIRSKVLPRVEERMRAIRVNRPALRRAWPAAGLLLIVPGIVTFESFQDNSGSAHASGINLDVAYAPTVHLNQPTTLTLTTMSVFGTKGHFSIKIGKKVFENFSITDIRPLPLSIEENHKYLFSGGGKDAVTITLVPKVIGRTAATLQYGLDPPVPFSITTVP